MKKHKVIVLLSGCCLAMLTPAAFAQGQPGGNGVASPGANVLHYGTAGEQGGGQGAQFGGPLEGSRLAMQPGQGQIMFRASRLIGMNAVSPQGQELGKLEEIVFHPQIGIVGVVATPTGRLVPIPWQLVSAITGQSLVFNTTLQALDAAPTVTGGEWANFNSPVFTHQIFGYFGIRPHAPMVAGAFGGRNFAGGRYGAGAGMGGYGGGYAEGGTTGAANGYGRSGAYGNGGYGNAGYGNAGYGNAGYGNAGYGNAGYGNAGYGNAGYGNAGFGNQGGSRAIGGGSQGRAQSGNQGGQGSQNGQGNQNGQGSQNGQGQNNQQ